MAYREPAVRVTQEFVNALPALAAFALPHVNVGPAYQIVTKAAAGSYAGIAANYSYPGQIAGTFVDPSPADPEDLVAWPVRIFLRDTVVRLLDQTGTGGVNPYDLNQFTDATLNIFENIVAGDVIVVTGSTMGNNGSYTIREVLSNNLVRTNETFAAVEAGLNYSIRRNIQATVGDIEIPRSLSGVVIDETQVSLPISITYDDPVFGTIPVISASVRLNYRALRVDKSAEIWEYSSTAELQADFGLDQVVPENPVVFAAFISLSSAAVPTNLLALGQSLLVPSPGNELVAYQNAFDVLALEDVYAINVLTQSTSVHTALKSHVETLSLPDRKLERVGIANRRLVTVAAVTDEKTTGVSEGISGSDPYLDFDDANASFITDGVVPGHYLNISAPSGVAGRFKIAAVVSQTKLLLESGPDMASNAVTYIVDKDLQKSEQADIIAAYAASLGSRRMVITWPDIVVIPVGPTPRQVPGYFLGATVGALTTGLPTQQGLTNLNVALFTGTRRSTKYFTGAQLNTIAAGGVMIFVQDVIDQTPLYIRHQLTTDTSAIKFQEYSVTKNVDFVAKFIRDNHRQFIGQYNIVDAALDDLKSNAQGLITFLKDSTRLPRIGGVIRSGRLTKLEVDPVNIDSVIERYRMDFPIPLNNLDITIVV